MPKEVIVITGCSGRCGFRVARKFSDPRFSVIGLDIKTPKVVTPNFEFIQTDITNDESVRNSFDRIRAKYGDTIACCIHLAAVYRYATGDWAMYNDVNVQGTRRVLDACKTFQTEQFLFASTMLVHPSCEPGQKITELWPQKPAWNYPGSKMEAENLILSEHEAIPIITFRIAECYDEGCHSDRLSRQIQKIYERDLQVSYFPGNLTHGITYLHFDDLVDAIWLAVQRRNSLASETTLLIGEPEYISIAELHKVIGLLLNGKEYSTSSMPKWLERTRIWLQNSLPFTKKDTTSDLMIELADMHYQLDISRIRELLGWAPRRSIRQALPKMIAFLKEDPSEWYHENELPFAQDLIRP